MKIVSLNTWCGKVFDPLLEWIGQNARTTDVFCFQEVFHTSTRKKIHLRNRVNLLREIRAVLPDFNDVYAPVMERFAADDGPVDFSVFFGLATFVRKTIPLINHDSFFIYRSYNKVSGNDIKTIPQNLLWVSVPYRDSTLTIGNMHGAWYPGTKIDTPQRLRQSLRIRSWMDTIPDTHILCGDFNLSLETKSLKILDKGMHNPIKECGIDSTRSKYYTWPNKHADYMLISPDVNIRKFTVVQTTVSDHLPLVCEI